MELEKFHINLIHSLRVSKQCFRAFLKMFFLIIVIIPNRVTDIFADFLLLADRLRIYIGQGF